MKTTLSWLKTHLDTDACINLSCRASLTTRCWTTPEEASGIAIEPAAGNGAGGRCSTSASAKSSRIASAVSANGRIVSASGRAFVVLAAIANAAVDAARRRT